MNTMTKGLTVVGATLAASLWLFSWPAARADDYGGAPRNARWAEECGACHVPYPPQMLPRASWERIMASMGEHFGENAELAPEVAEEIRAYLVAHSADARGMAWRRGDDDDHRVRAARFDTPLRVTETRWFLDEHDEIGAEVWKRQSIGSPANCGACHREAAQGRFSEHGVKIPR